MPTAAQVYKMLENESLWQTARKVHDTLEQADISHALLGGVAVCLHGYQRNTVDIDVLIRPEDAAHVRAELEKASFVWHPDQAEFRSPTGIAVQILRTGDRAGARSEVRLPDPGDARATTEIEGLKVLILVRPIDSKIACGEGNPRRTHKDFADVVELIICNRLDSSFARRLHKSLRNTFRTLPARQNVTRTPALWALP